MEGLIVKGIGGFYYVKSGTVVYECKARGIFKKEGIVPTVGDKVSIEILADGKAVINDIYPRKNIFIRPSIANVDCFVVVVAATQPNPSRAIVDKFLVMAEKSHTDIILCINKIDLADDARLKRMKETYEHLYKMVFVSGETGQGIRTLKEMLVGKVAALTGPSGVGKSTLLNAIMPNVFAETGEISSKTQRGRHTTRHVEIFDMEFGGMIFDTPGFTSFEILEAGEEELQFLYPEMLPYIGKCRYDNCRHLREPDCAVRKAVAEEKIKKSRYTSYIEQLNEIIEKERNKY